jgi:23S rRNA (cytidine1920-2'-O)/16S rRNA (cytidine1409-2'-O)-methyltransferase
VITDPVVWRRVLEEVADALEELGAAIMGAMASPLTGADGNVEFLLHARTRPAESSAVLTEVLNGALAEVGPR